MTPDDPLPAGFTVTCLLYGDFPRLAVRCLGSIVSRLDPTLVPDLRVLCNAVSPATRDAVRNLLCGAPATTRVLMYDSPVNRLKYPMMRKALYDETNPVVTPYFVWFDDDSCLAPESSAGWWGLLHDVLQSADVAGKLYRTAVRAGQPAAVARQPWYNHLPVPGPVPGTPTQGNVGGRFVFPTGGFWAARTRLLYRWDYPFPDVVHNGGDVMLGELCRQQQLRMVNFDRGVWVNADEAGNPSKAPRRGVSKDPVWAANPVTGGGPAYPKDHSHHDFTVEPFDPREE